MRKLMLVVPLLLALLGNYPASAQECMTLEKVDAINQPQGWSPAKKFTDQEFMAFAKVRPGVRGLTGLAISINMDLENGVVAALFLKDECIIGVETGPLEEFRQIMREVFGKADGS